MRAGCVAGISTAAVLLANGCASQRSAVWAAAAAPAAAAPAAAVPAPGTVASLPGWNDDDLHGLRIAVERQCALARPPRPWPVLCTQLPPSTDFARWIETRFDAWPIVGADGAREGLLTGYYEPLLHGTRTRVNERQVPLHARPADLVARADGSRGRLHAGRSDGPYLTRAQIDDQGLPSADVLLWLDDPIEAFFLHVQGSGRVRLPDGTTVRVGFADHNGHAYRAIGRELIARGALAAPEVNAASIRAWLRAHPDRMRSVLHANPRYIFFRELPATASEGGVSAMGGLSSVDPGPPGSLGVPLTPMRSVATDPAFVPPGALLFLDGVHPESGAPMRRVVVSQDRGAAIVGAVRADLFWGTGDEAGRLAGLARQPMRMWLLWPKGEAPPR